jgi:RNA polymerase sigma factor (sigma-70 family)
LFFGYLEGDMTEQSLVSVQPFNIGEFIGIKSEMVNRPMFAARAAKGLTHEELGKRVGNRLRGKPVSLETIANFENLKEWPDTDVAAAIAVVLEVPLEMLFPLEAMHLRAMEGPELISLDNLRKWTARQHQSLVQPMDEAVTSEAERAVLAQDIRRALGYLTARERRIVTLRFGLTNDRCWTLAEVGDELGMSREKVRQAEAVALRKLRQPEVKSLLSEYFLEA